MRTTLSRLLLFGSLVALQQATVVRGGGHATVEDADEAPLFATDDAASKPAGADTGGGADGKKFSEVGDLQSGDASSTTGSSTASGSGDSTNAGLPAWALLFQSVRHPLILVFLVFFGWRHVGRWRNSRIAQSVFGPLSGPEFWKAAKIAKMTEMEEKDGHIFEAVGLTERNAGFCMMVQTQRREDSFYCMFSGWIWPDTDRLILEIELPDLDPYSIAILRKGTSHRTEHRNLKESKPRLKVQYVDAGEYLVVADQTEPLTQLVETNCIEDSLLLKILNTPRCSSASEQKGSKPDPTNADTKLVECVHISYKYQRHYFGVLAQRFPPMPILSVTLRVDEGVVETARKILPLMAKLADQAVSKVKLPESLKKKIALAANSAGTTSGGPGGLGSKAGDGASSAADQANFESNYQRQKHLERQAHERKLAKKKEERAKVLEMTPEQQMKYEEKERQRELKKRMTGGGKIKRMSVAA
ncbi:unnamed protein product [Amoebophrya sp. A120]|nr:unnamed protein product [Amoebophrya sp. A120]|eukprot:GSA120T00025697001.1